MGIFSRKPKGGKKASAVKFDPYLGREDWRQAVKQAQAGAFAAGSQLLAQPDGWMLSGILLDKVPLHTVQQWVAEDPNEMTESLLGRAQIAAAWKIRGTGFADSVSPEQWEGFRAGIAEADETLQTAVRKYPRSPEPWVGLLTTGRAQSKRLPEIRSRFNEVHDRAPFRSDACNTMLQALCAKWQGSHEDMFEFARWAEEWSPPDSRAHTLLPTAHLEYAWAESDIKVSEYLTRPDVNAEILGAATKFTSALPPELKPQHLSVLNWYLFALIPSNAAGARLYEQIAKRLGDRPTNSPWDSWSNPIGERFASTRARRLERAKAL